eukprot:12561602-Alexandrium_andersonii.AAC.1
MATPLGAPSPASPPHQRAHMAWARAADTGLADRPFRKPSRRARQERATRAGPEQLPPAEPPEPPADTTGAHVEFAFALDDVDAFLDKPQAFVGAAVKNNRAE